LIFFKQRGIGGNIANANAAAKSATLQIDFFDVAFVRRPEMPHFDYYFLGMRCWRMQQHQCRWECRGKPPTPHVDFVFFGRGIK